MRLHAHREPHLNEAQAKAVWSVLMHRVAQIQGPPGQSRVRNCCCSDLKEVSQSFE